MQFIHKNLQFHKIIFFYSTISIEKLQKKSILKNEIQFLKNQKIEPMYICTTINNNFLNHNNKNENKKY